MSYQIQVFDSRTAAYVPTEHASDDLRSLRRLITSRRFIQPVRIVDASGTVIPGDTPAGRAGRPLMLEDIARIMGVEYRRPAPTDA